MKLYKATNREEKHYGMSYATGINRDVLPWDPSGSCSAGGIYYSDEQNIFAHLYGKHWLREVTLLPESRTYADPEGGKWKTDILSLGERRALDNALLKELLDAVGNKVGGDLYLSGTAITALPEGLSVGGDLDLSGTAITALPEGLSVGGSLFLRRTAITALPEGLSVSGDLDL